MTRQVDGLGLGLNGRSRRTLAVARPAWFDHRACNDVNPDVFFPTEPGAEGRRLVAVARSYCVTCPVRLECLIEALACREEYGIWGGYTERERREIARVVKSLTSAAAVTQVA